MMRCCTWSLNPPCPILSASFCGKGGIPQTSIYGFYCPGLLRISLADGFHICQIAHSSRLEFVSYQMLSGDDVRRHAVDRRFRSILPRLVKGHPADVRSEERRVGKERRS